MASRQALGAEISEQTRPEDLARAARAFLGEAPIVIASNREPYQHVHTPSGIEVIRSAGGLASALDSVARATGATWVAQGAADADRAACDAMGRPRAPGDERSPSSGCGSSRRSGRWSTVGSATDASGRSATSST
jgi:trehalose-6-phosphate synthase